MSEYNKCPICGGKKKKRSKLCAPCSAHGVVRCRDCLTGIRRSEAEEAIIYTPTLGEGIKEKIYLCKYCCEKYDVQEIHN